MQFAQFWICLRLFLSASICVAIECRCYTVIVFVTNTISRTAISALLFATTAANIPEFIVSNRKSICTTIHATCIATICRQPILGIDCITAATTSTSKIIHKHKHHKMKLNRIHLTIFTAITIPNVSSIGICLSAGLASIGFAVPLFSTEITTTLMELRCSLMSKYETRLLAVEHRWNKMVKMQIQNAEKKELCANLLKEERKKTMIENNKRKLNCNHYTILHILYSVYPWTQNCENALWMLVI